MVKKYNIVIAIILLALAIGIVAFMPKSTVNAPSDEPVVQKPDTSAYIRVAGEQKEKYEFIAEYDGQTVLDLVSRYVKADVKQMDFGTLLEAVNDVPADKARFWAFYVNDEFTQKDIAKMHLKKGDRVTLILQETEAIKGI